MTGKVTQALAMFGADTLCNCKRAFNGDCQQHGCGYAQIEAAEFLAGKLIQLHNDLMHDAD